MSGKIFINYRRGDDPGTGLKSLTETIDTATAGGEFIFTVFAALAQFERSLIRERTNEGLKNARAKGHKSGPKFKLSEKDARQIEAMLRDKIDYRFISDIIAASQISRATFYRHFPRDRIERLRSKAAGT